MQYDVLVGGDWRLEGGITVSVEHEIRALSGIGLKVGILQLDSHLSGLVRPLAPQLAAQVDAGRASFVQDLASATTRLLSLRHPAIIPLGVDRLKRIAADRVVVVVDRPPLDGMGANVYYPNELHGLLEKLYPGKISWAPISGVCRLNLLSAAHDLPVLDRDWINFLYCEEWASDRTAPNSDIPVVGRHSRPAWDKWPDNRRQLLAAYPDTSEIDVRFLGTGDRLIDLAGAIPTNWTLHEWDEMPVRQFLGGIDFFVYYHHSTWIEGFGRNILEAMASGCVVILPEYLRHSFGEGALYLSPEKVGEKVRELHRSWPKFLKQSRIGQGLAKEQFGPQKFLEAIGSVVNGNMTRKMHLPTVGSNTRDTHEITLRKRLARERNSTSLSKPFDKGKDSAPSDRTLRSADAFRILKKKSGGDRKHNAGKVIASNSTDVPPAEIAMTAMRKPSFAEFDVVYLIDLSAGRETCERIAEEIRLNFSAGFTSAVLGSGDASQPSQLPSCLAELLLQGQAALVSGPGAWTATRLLIITSPGSFHDGSPPRLSADRVIVIPNSSYKGDARSDHEHIRRSFGDNVSWTGVSPLIRARLENAVPLERMPWTTSVLARPPAAESPTRGRIVIGHVSQANKLCWPAAKWLNKIYPDSDEFIINTLAWPKGGLDGLPEPPSNWQIFDSERITLRKFIEKLDVLVFFPQVSDVELPMTAIALALTQGLPVILPPVLRAAIGRGPFYSEPANVVSLAKSLLSSKDRLQQKRAEISNAGNATFGPQHQYRRLVQYVGSKRPVLSKTLAKSRMRRIIMLSSNGTGLGHVTRQLAVARRLSASVDPIFVTMGHGVGLIRQFGYVAEYIPSQIYTHTSLRHWEEWFGEEIREHIRFYGAELVVYDGNTPPMGLLRAVGPRSDIRLAWIRRGMWGQNQSSPIRLQKYFDLVIEPTDIAGEFDKGATAQARHDVVIVPPIRLLDGRDLLSRNDARQKLGLDSRKPAVLIQIGSGSNRDNISMIDELIRHLRGISDLQIAIAKWDISSDSLRLWPGTHLVEGYPLSQYFNAFDFTVAAAGYNSFNEIISFGLPAVFVPNRHPSMDDQGGRADYAEKQGAAITLPESNLGEILQILPVLLNEKSRAYIKSNCIRIAMDNGAKAAAAQLERVLMKDRGND